MSMDWQELTRLTAGAELAIERVRLAGREISIEGNFELPPLARLSAEDQVFVMAFVRSHGSIKEMERVFGISYPTVKGRLNRISEQFELGEVLPPSAGEDVLELLGRGEISVDDAIGRLSQ